MDRCLYIMLSRTTTGIGWIIRGFSRFDYNHVSVSLDPSLRHWVSFARYVRCVPLAGGFVKENAERFFDMDGPVLVRIYRMPLDEDRWQQLNELFSMAGHSRLIYNTFEIFAAVFGRHYSVPGAYTCLDFACAVLNQDFSKLAELDAALAPHLLYGGDYKDLFLDDGLRDDSYFTHCTIRRAVLDTAGHFARLVYRSFGLSNCQDPILKLNSGHPQ